LYAGGCHPGAWVVGAWAVGAEDEAVCHGGVSPDRWSLGGCQAGGEGTFCSVGRGSEPDDEPLDG